jgi:predicted ATP-dependent endonuclease of OLD family
MSFFSHAPVDDVEEASQYQWDAKPNTTVTASGQEALAEAAKAENAVLVGRNNCGKSFLLKTMTQRIGQNASYLGPARYQNFNVLSYYTPRRNRKAEKWSRFVDDWSNNKQNIDNSPIDLQKAIAELSDSQRGFLTEIIEMLLGSRIDILHTVHDNSMSQKYVSCNGHNLSFTSSGFRLITTLVTSLLDDEYDTFLIDEPELGISPEAQGTLADFLFDKAHRQKYFSHIKTLILATHSTVFLDRHQIGNNYAVTKNGNTIDVQKTSSITEFNNIHFLLLGNRLESLYLPACILLVEGKSDHAYLSRVVELAFPCVQLSIINAHSDSRMKEIVSLAGSLFTDLQKSPYRTRIVPILDTTHGRDVVTTLKEAGIPVENFVIWDQNGIEYYYPESIIDKIYGAGMPLEIDGDLVSRNGISHKKWHLCELVLTHLNDVSVVYPEEFERKLLNSIRRICDVA